MRKMDQEKERKSFEAFMKNPSWKRIYEGAPSTECKDYYRYSFYFSKYYDPDAEDASEFDKLQEYYYDKLSIQDWEYIKKNSGNSPFVGYCNERIAALKNER